MRIPNVSQRKDSANSERIQQFCTCKKRNLLCCAIGCQCRRRLCYRGSNDPKAGGRRQQAEASSLRQCLATIPSRTLGSMGGWDYLLAGEKPKSRVGRKWRAVGGLPLFEIQGWRLLALFVRTRLVLPSNRYRQASALPSVPKVDIEGSPF